MIQTIEVEIDADGVAHAVNHTVRLPQGRALLTWQTGDEHECYLLSHAALAVDWLTSEEDAAWAYLQPEK